MSDLSRLRSELASSERAGKRVKAELAKLREELAGQPRGINRSEEREVQRLEASLDFWRKRWAAIHKRLEAEERRYIADPAAPLRFT